jgi:G6PDH family F420-dependent oxidoreductase
VVGDRCHLAGHLPAHYHRGDVPAGPPASCGGRPAAATAALLTGGRFILGPGTGENLNEHILGQRWPSAGERLEMLEEAVSVMRDLFSGRLVSHTGQHYTVDTARLYSVPPTPPPIYMSGFGQRSIKLAARIADGYVCVPPNADFVRLYRESGGGDRPVQGGFKVCWAPDETQARKTMYRLWRTDEIPGEAGQLLTLPRHFGDLTELITEDMISAPAARIPRCTSGRSRPIVTRASMRCTSARSVPTPRVSSSSIPPRCCRG